MRQAGRYLPEYREVRSRVSFMQLCRDPELIAEVVRQPVRRFGLDAAILFSDILIPLEPMGVGLKFPDIGGPILKNPIAEPGDVARVCEYDVTEKLPFVFEGIRAIKRSMPDVPVIGFAGSPFTLACYLIQGRGGQSFDRAKQFFHRHPAAGERLLEALTEMTSQYLAAQIDAGADAIQLFDSWGGILSKDDYVDWSAKPSRTIFARLKSESTPRILFVNNVAPYLDLIRDLDCDVVGVDYRMDLADAAAALPGKTVQGNLDPTLLFGSRELIVNRTLNILDSLDRYDNIIFNLGHGILPETPVESVEVLVETVHGYRGQS
jgi:uroporphyrinogen decarboxylase